MATLMYRLQPFGAVYFGRNFMVPTRNTFLEPAGEENKDDKKAALEQAKPGKPILSVLHKLQVQSTSFAPLHRCKHTDIP